jgi:hypothetical protein
VDASVTDGVFTSSFDNVTFERGAKGTRVGDTVGFSDCRFRGSEYAINMTFIPGATGILLHHCNVISGKGIYVDGVTKGVIDGGTIVELFMAGSTGNKGATITVKNSQDFTVDDAVVSNFISGVDLDGVRIDNSLAAVVSRSRFYVPNKYAIKPVHAGDVVRHSFNHVLPTTPASLGEIDTSVDKSGYTAVAGWHTTEPGAYQDAVGAIAVKQAYFSSVKTELVPITGGGTQAVNYVTGTVFEVDSSAGPTTLTLPQITGGSNPQHMRDIWVIKTDGTANAVTLQRSGSSTFSNGNPSFPLATQGKVVHLKASATSNKWLILGSL